jgi:SAM-dependent methyltransferase
MAEVTFDAQRYKETTREQWQEAAAAWNRWDPFFDEWLGPATEEMLDLAGVGAGSRVIDIAAGSGGQTIPAARRAGEQGAVLATDSSERILELAAFEARRAGLANVATKVMDGEDLDVAPASFDAAISRLGLMYMPDKQRSLESARAALRPGGRYAAIVFAEPDRNGFFAVPIGIIRRRAELPPPAPGLPGPFSAVNVGELLDEAGFTDVEVRRVEAPLLMASAAECAQLERESFGALHQMLSGLPQPEREDAWAEVEEALGQFEHDGRFTGPCELLVAAGTS